MLSKKFFKTVTKVSFGAMILASVSAISKDFTESYFGIGDERDVQKVIIEGIELYQKLNSSKLKTPYISKNSNAKIVDRDGKVSYSYKTSSLSQNPLIGLGTFDKNSSSMFVSYKDKMIFFVPSKAAETECKIKVSIAVLDVVVPKVGVSFPQNDIIVNCGENENLKGVIYSVLNETVNMVDKEI